MAGGEPLAWGDIESWARLLGEQPIPEEVRALIAMDAAYLAEGREFRDRESKKEADAKPPKGGSKRRTRSK